jgi:hypothetical protein
MSTMAMVKSFFYEHWIAMEYDEHDGNDDEFEIKKNIKKIF